jgi:hypothetical protein
MADQKLFNSVCNPGFPWLCDIDYNQIQIHILQNISSSKDIPNGGCLAGDTGNSRPRSYTTNFDYVRPRFAHSRPQQGKGSLPTSPARIKGTTKKTCWLLLAKQGGIPLVLCSTLTCWLGNCVVRRVSCVSSLGRRLGLLKISADWSIVPAIVVIR